MLDLSMLEWNFEIMLGDILVFLPDFCWILFCMLNLGISLYLSKFIRSIQLNHLIIDLTIPLVIFSFYLVYQYIDLKFFLFFDFILDNFYIISRLILLMFLLLCLISSRFYFTFNRLYLFEYSFILLLSVEGLFLMLFSINLFLFFLSLELQNLCLYILASIKRYSNFSTEAGLKYFILGSFSSSLIIFGISLLYGLFGTVNLYEMNMLYESFLFSNSMGLLMIAMLFLVSGFLFKIGSAPFHWWVPDVYQGSPLIVTMIFSILPKIALILCFIKYIFMYLPNFDYLQIILLFCGILSLYYGGMNALFQYNLKRFLGYSAITNVGYILLSFSLGNIDGYVSGVSYLVFYLINLIVLFFFIINNRNFLFSKINDIFDFSLIYNSNKWFSIFMAFVFFSLVGIPPLIGFFGKFFIFVSLANNFNYLLLFLLLLFTILSGFYYVRIVRFIFFSVSEVNAIYVNYNFSFIFCLLFLIILLPFFFLDSFMEFLYFLFIIY